MTVEEEGADAAAERLAVERLAVERLAVERLAGALERIASASARLSPGLLPGPEGAQPAGQGDSLSTQVAVRLDSLIARLRATLGEPA